MGKHRPFGPALVALLLCGGARVPAAPASPDATDTVVFCTPYPKGTAPLLTLVRTIDVEGRPAMLAAVLGSAGADPLMVANRVLMQASSLRVGTEDAEVPDHVGDAICGETTWAVPVNGGGAEELPPYGALSPGGRWYAFSRLSPGEGRRLWLRAGTGEVPTPLYMAGDSGKPREIVWSPDERYLAADAFPEPLRRGEQVIVVETQTWQTRFSRLRAAGARWSPDGHRLAWIRWPSGAEGRRMPQVEVWNTESGEVTTLAQVPQGTCHLRWSPDGQSLLLLVAPPGGEDAPPQQLWLLPLQGGELTRIYQAQGLGVLPLAWTSRGDGFWAQSGWDILLLRLQGGAAAERMRIATGPEALPPEAVSADIKRAAEKVREALAAATRARAAVAAFCTDLGPPGRELAHASGVFAGLPAACPGAGLIPAQCAQYARAMMLQAQELPVAACLARMGYLSGQLVFTLLKNGMLPPAPPAGPIQDPRFWVTPGARDGEQLRIRYRMASGGTPRPGQVVLECGPFGDRVVRLRWPERVTAGQGSSCRYASIPKPAVEAAQ